MIQIRKIFGCRQRNSWTYLRQVVFEFSYIYILIVLHRCSSTLVRVKESSGLCGQVVLIWKRVKADLGETHNIFIFILGIILPLQVNFMFYFYVIYLQQIYH